MRRRFDIVLGRVAAGEHVTVTRSGTPVADLHPLGRPAVKAEVLDSLGGLEPDPHIGHQLRGRLTGLRSYRVGVYRIIYELRDDKTVRVVAIRHRGNAHDSDRR